MKVPDAETENITFHVEHGQQLEDESRLRRWIEETLAREGRQPGRIAFTFVSDPQLLTLNQRHLQHDTYTDILTFPYNAEPVEAEIFISTDRVADNSTRLGVPYEEELRRVMIHGILHMCGYRDKSPEELQGMRAREDFYLERW